jgi:hypothetical protein
VPQLFFSFVDSQKQNHLRIAASRIELHWSAEMVEEQNRLFAFTRRSDPAVEAWRQVCEAGENDAAYTTAIIEFENAEPTTLRGPKHPDPPPPLGGGCGAGVQTSQSRSTKFLIFEKVGVVNF